MADSKADNKLQCKLLVTSGSSSFFLFCALAHSNFAVPGHGEVLQCLLQDHLLRWCRRRRCCQGPSRLAPGAFFLGIFMIVLGGVSDLFWSVHYSSCRRSGASRACGVFLWLLASLGGAKVNFFWSLWLVHVCLALAIILELCWKNVFVDNDLFVSVVIN